tara:strand:- start:321 stop:761 length:441 start_codon:yes stop_codon:yes gene_type:complete
VSRTSNILKATERRTDDNSKYEKELMSERQRLDKYLEREEVEKEKSEGQKQHERYRRKQQSVAGADLTSLIKPAKAEQQRPGTFFYGTLKKLGNDFDNDISTMEKYFTLGQSSKFRPCNETNKIYCIATGAVLYDCGTGECFENNT